MVNWFRRRGVGSRATDDSEEEFGALAPFAPAGTCARPAGIASEARRVYTGGWVAELVVRKSMPPGRPNETTRPPDERLTSCWSGRAAGAPAGQRGSPLNAGVIRRGGHPMGHRT